MLLAEYPPCDCNAEHIATVHCPECEESFCEPCDKMIHARKKNREHERQMIELEPEPEPEPEVEEEMEPVPCDSDETHEAVMYCEGRY